MFSAKQPILREGCPTVSSSNQRVFSEASYVILANSQASHKLCVAKEKSIPDRREPTEILIVQASSHADIASYKALHLETWAQTERVFLSLDLCSRDAGEVGDVSP